MIDNIFKIKRPYELPDIETAKDIFLELEDHGVKWGMSHFQKSQPISYHEVTKIDPITFRYDSNECDNTLSFVTKTFMITSYQIDAMIYSKNQTYVELNDALNEVILRLEDFLGEKPKIEYHQCPIPEIGSYRQTLNLSMKLYKCDRI